MTPLTHHDIVRLASPFTRLGLQVDLDASDRARRTIRFRSQSADEAGGQIVQIHHELDARQNNELHLRRALWHPAGLASVLHASGADMARLSAAMDAVPLSDQLNTVGSVPCARSFRLWLSGGRESGHVSIELVYLAARVNHLVLTVDVSAGGGMPAEAILALTDSPVNHPVAGVSGRQRSTLASGDWIPGFDPLLQGCHARPLQSVPAPEVPDDLLAVLGDQWRPLRPRGDHLRTVLRQLGRPPGRADRADSHFQAAVAHLEQVLSAPASSYHQRFGKQRRVVYLRRLRPVLLLAAIFALMPLVYLAVVKGGMTLHPLMLGVTPLLMVAAIALSVREIPVIEWPAWPAPLPEGALSKPATSARNRTA